MTEENHSHTNPEVLEKASRRRFTAGYKLRLLDEAERCAGQGQIGELLRREGLYSSHLTSWRRQRDAGALDALEPKPRGRKPKASNPAAKELERLRRENQGLRERLRQAKTIIEFQKKVSEVLGIPLRSSNNDELA